MLPSFTQCCALETGHDDAQQCSEAARDQWYMRQALLVLRRVINTKFRPTMRSSHADLLLSSSHTYDAMTWNTKANGIDQDSDRSCRKFAGSRVAASICLDDYLMVPCQAWIQWNNSAGIATLTVPAPTLMSCLVTHTNSRSHVAHQ